ncbi:cytochrome c [Sansalvadorimonas sp. 2012CJ34-2]|uniref:Cytochrome c n=1 Tax=Parendozoicomonas callyspongiae TaxID=2942213 RepID=A0ABT0PJL4_9GAMM|nr:cytochrome c [Sansalvadorimonas sp. 2012CJ34-2]
MPEKLGIGFVPSPELVKAWDTAIQPDGRGLPPGKGCVTDGQRIYVEQCQVCHGISGKGGQYDVLAGRLAENLFPFAAESGHPKTIGNYWPWATTLFDYIRRSMPLLTPGTLSDNDVYALSAYLLHLNELLPESACLDAASLPQIEMPANKRFVPDNRLETSAVR